MAIALLFTTLASLTLLVVGLMGLTGRLPRNHIAGLRTPSIMRTDETWETAHRIGSPWMIFAAVASLMAGLAFLPFVLADEVGHGLATVVVIVQAAVILAGVLLAWVVGERAIRSGGPSESRT